MVVLVYGPPGVGKTTVFKLLLQHAPILIDKPFCHYLTDYGYIFGNYEEEPRNPFIGTDKLSMSVQPMATEFVLQHPDTDFFIEGDRLFNDTFITTLRAHGIQVAIVFIEASKESILSRRAQRIKENNLEPQDGAFLAAKETKINNIKRKHDYHVLLNNGESGPSYCADALVDIAAGNQNYLIINPQTDLFNE